MTEEDLKTLIGSVLRLCRAGLVSPFYVAALEDLADRVLGWE